MYFTDEGHCGRKRPAPDQGHWAAGRWCWDPDPKVWLQRPTSGPGFLTSMCRVAIGLTFLDPHRHKLSGALLSPLQMRKLRLKERSRADVQKQNSKPFSTVPQTILRPHPEIRMGRYFSCLGLYVQVGAGQLPITPDVISQK